MFVVAPAIELLHARDLAVLSVFDIGVDLLPWGTDNNGCAPPSMAPTRQAARYPAQRLTRR